MRFRNRILLNTVMCFILSMLRSNIYSASSSSDVLKKEVLHDKATTTIYPKQKTIEPSRDWKDDDNLSVDCNSPELECRNLNATCFRCKFNYSCIYGQDVQSRCEIIQGAQCKVSFRTLSLSSLSL